MSTDPAHPIPLPSLAVVTLCVFLPVVGFSLSLTYFILRIWARGDSEQQRKPGDKAVNSHALSTSIL